MTEDWNKLSQNLNIPIDFLINNSNYGINWDFISLRNDLDFKLVKNNLDKQWSYYYLAVNNKK